MTTAELWKAYEEILVTRERLKEERRKNGYPELKN